MNQNSKEESSGHSSGASTPLSPTNSKTSEKMTSMTRKATNLAMNITRETLIEEHENEPFNLILKKFFVVLIKGAVKQSGKMWGVIILVLVLYQTLFVPIRAFFFVGSLWWLFSDVFCWIIYALDIVFNFIMATHEGTKSNLHDLKLRQLKGIRRVIQTNINYAKGWFFFDLVSVIPFFIVGVSVNLFRPYYPFFLLNRIVKTAKILQITKTIQESYKERISLPVSRLFQNVVVATICIHLTSCVYFLLVYIQGDNNSSDFTPAGIDMLVLTPYQQYIRCFFWALVTMTGYSNTHPQTTLEIIFSLLISVFGLMLYITIIGTVGSLVSNLDAAGREFETRMKEINSFAGFRKLPTDLKGKLIDYYQYLWKSRQNFEEDKILKELPLHLKVEIANSLNKGVFKRISIFSRCSDTFLENLTLHLKPLLLLPEETLINRGDIGNEMYFIVKGGLVREDYNGEILKLFKGDHFGEEAMAFNYCRKCSYRAMRNYCELYVLHKSDFRATAEGFAEDEKKILKAAKAKYGTILKEERAIKEKMKMIFQKSKVEEEKDGKEEK